MLSHFRIMKIGRKSHGNARLLFVSIFVKLYVLISFEDHSLLNNQKLKRDVICKGIGDHQVHAEESRFNVLMSSDVFPVRGKLPLVKDEM